MKLTSEDIDIQDETGEGDWFLFIPIESVGNNKKEQAEQLKQQILKNQKIVTKLPAILEKIKKMTHNSPDYECVWMYNILCDLEDELDALLTKDGASTP